MDKYEFALELLNLINLEKHFSLIHEKDRLQGTIDAFNYIYDNIEYEENE